MGVRTDEHEAALEISPAGLVERHRDAVVGGFRLASCQALPWTGERAFLLGRAGQEIIDDRSSRQSYGTLDDPNIFFRAIDDRLLETDVGVALLGRGEAGSHLDGIGTQLHDAVDVLAGENPSAGDDRNVLAELLYVGSERFLHLGDSSLERESFILEILHRDSKVSSCFRSFDDDRIGNVLVHALPHGEDQAGSSRGADDRNYLDTGFAQLGHRHVLDGQAGTEENHVDTLLDRGLQQGLVILERDHDIHPDHPFSVCAGFPDLTAQGAEVRCAAVGEILGVDHAYAVRRDDADTSLARDCRGKAGEADAHAHAALHDGEPGDFFTDGEVGNIEEGEFDP